MEFKGNLEADSMTINLECYGINLTKPLEIEDAYKLALEALALARSFDYASPRVLCRCEEAVNINGFIIGAKHTRMKDSFLLYGKIRTYDDACDLSNLRVAETKVKMFGGGLKTASLDYAPAYFPLFDGFEIDSKNAHILLEIFKEFRRKNIYALGSASYEEFLTTYRDIKPKRKRRKSKAKKLQLKDTFKD